MYVYCKKAKTLTLLSLKGLDGVNIQMLTKTWATSPFSLASFDSVHCFAKKDNKLVEIFPSIETFLRL